MNKIGQEEIVGFVVIVVIVSVILVIFLGIFLNNDDLDRNKESIEVFQFLDSVMSYTSECAIGFQPNFLNFGNLIKECHAGGSLCVSGEDPCNVFESSFKKITERSFNIDEESFYKGYEARGVFLRNVSEEEIFFFNKGACKQAFRGSELPLSALDGTIIVSLKLCF